MKKNAFHSLLLDIWHFLIGGQQVGSVATRRKAINKILVDLPEYEGYEEYCMKIITEH